MNLPGKYFTNTLQLEVKRVYTTYLFTKKIIQLLLLFKVFFNSLPLLSQSTIEQHILIADSIFEANPDSAFYLAKSAYLLSDKSNELLLKAKSALIIGKVLFYQGNYRLANDYLVESNQIFSELTYDVWIAESNIWLGAVHQYTRQYAIAFNFYSEALQLFEKGNDHRGIANALTWIGHYYEKVQQYDSAKLYHEKAEEEFRKHQDGIGLSIVYDNLGSIFEDLQQLDSAYHYFQKAAHLNNKLNRISDFINNLNNIGDVYRKKGIYTLATQYTDSALVLAKDYNLDIQEKYALRDRSKIFADQAMYDSAYYYAELGYALHRNILDEKIPRRIALLNALHESHRKEERIEQLEKYESMSSMFKRITLILGTLIVVFIVGFVIFIRKRSRSNSKTSTRTEGILMVNEHGVLESELELRKELELKAMNEARLCREMDMKDQMLSTYLLQSINKKNFIESMKDSLVTIKRADKKERNKEIQRLIATINSTRHNDEEWEEFKKVFENLHNDFYSRLNRNFPELSPNELKLAALLKMNLDTGDIAAILKISPDSLRVSRYRLRKKLNIAKGANLVSFLIDY